MIHPSHNARLSRMGDQFIDAEAVTPESAKSLQDLGLKASWLNESTIDSMVMRGFLIHVGEEKYYLDRPLFEKKENQRYIALFIMLFWRASCM